jgi:DNA recombination protein RmuC
MLTGLVVGLVAGAVVGVVVALAVSSARSSARAAKAQVERNDALNQARVEVARLESALEHERRVAAEREAALDETRRQLVGEFAELSIRALEQNSTQFLELADTRLKEANQVAAGDLEHRKQAIEQLLVPLREQLGKYEEGLRLLEVDRQRAYTGLHEQVRQLTESQDRLQAETRNLVTALRAPATRGRWGEMQLRRVVEMAGMVEHCDFEEQVSVDGEDGRLRPDLVVRLPGAKQVVVDAKVPLQAFLDANDATDEAGRKVHLVNHARHLRAHVDALAKKAYWQQFDDTPDFVVAFVPGDPLLAAALENDSSLLEHAMANHVLLATPTTLVALLRSVAYGWQQEALAENAREVQRMGRDLYKRIATFGEHLARMGKGLNTAVEAYNKAVGSLERNVLPQARRFQELGLVGSGEKELAPLDQVDATSRQLQAPELVVGRPALSALPFPDGDDEDGADSGLTALPPPAAAR